MVERKKKNKHKSAILSRVVPDPSVCGHASRLCIYALPRGFRRYGHTAGGEAFDRTNNELVKGGKAPTGHRRSRAPGTDGAKTPLCDPVTFFLKLVFF